MELDGFCRVTLGVVSLRETADAGTVSQRVTRSACAHLAVVEGGYLGGGM